eukprot:TRINITY_DN26558_c0_g1_i1.p1 TRINITY_DN26558_c0_g1~~TRINITY_DN26558_c0_g1_i1.p1  ORF type:complete len:1124 (+),score=277.79 TRINITY_DN26558_c0_g1_i1:139-3510(+)
MGEDSGSGSGTDEDENNARKILSKPSAKGKAKAAGKRRDILDWEVHHLPAISERDVVQIKIDREKVMELRKQALQKIEAGQRPDPAEFNRKWRLNFAVTGIESWLDETIDVFLSISLGAVGDKVETQLKKIKTEYVFTKKYRVTSEEPTMFESEEQIYNKPLEFSYKQLQDQYVMMDVWSVSSFNFNQLVGSAQVTFYDLAIENLHQAIPIYQDQKSFIGQVHVKAVMSELFEFKILAANWYFKLRPDMENMNQDQKKLKIGVPEEPEGNEKKFETAPCPGPKYCWPMAGEFVYVGTDLSMSMEAISVEVISGSSTQGKAIVTMAAALEYPVAIGTVKNMCPNKEDYVQGKVAGSVLVTKRSVLLEPGMIDEESSVRPPMQPPESLITFFLSPKMQYLVVELGSADGLAIADTDMGTSNAMGRVKYDGVVFQSNVVEASLTPVWNQTFYIPVRVVDETIRTDETHYKNLLPVEMQSKGFLEVEVWHYENTPTEFLGLIRVDLARTRYAKMQERAICDKAANEARAGTAKDTNEKDEGANDITIGIDPMLAKKHPCRVLEVKREAILGSKLPSSMGRASVSFDCYFVPDFPDDFKFLAQDDIDESSAGAAQLAEKNERFAACFEKWESHWKEFNYTYKTWFPDSVQTRTWPYKFLDNTGVELPLVSLIVPCALPSTLEQPQALLHWVRSIEFIVPARQRAVGEMTQWSRPDAVLAVRKGSVQDHAVVLCCALLGLRKDAFVCKGTLQGGRDHAWVLTREAEGAITFWETTTGCKYHIAGRWANDPDHGDSTKGAIESKWAARGLNMKWKNTTDERASFSRPQHFQFMDDLMKLTISPWKELMNPELVVPVPYETIELVFNGDQMWGNLGNADPTCIYYDMEDDAKSWMSLLPEDEQSIVNQTRSDVLPVGLAISDFVVENMVVAMEHELKECIKMIRMRIGFETNYVDDDMLYDMLGKYLEMLENEARLDADWCHNEEGKPKKPWAALSPYNAQGYVDECKAAWQAHWEKQKELEEDKAHLSVKENHTLSGVPVHFSSDDMKTIRYNLMHCEALKEYFELKKDDALFFVIVKVFPMAGAVSSTWVFIGAEIPMEKEDIVTIAQELAKELEEEESVASGSGSERS